MSKDCLACNNTKAENQEKLKELYRSIQEDTDKVKEIDFEKLFCLDCRAELGLYMLNKLSNLEN